MPCGAVERLPALHHSADYIFISFGITGPVVVALKIELCSCKRKRGISSVANVITTYEKFKKTILTFSVCIVFFVSKGILLEFDSKDKKRSNEM